VGPNVSRHQALMDAYRTMPHIYLRVNIAKVALQDPVLCTITTQFGARDVVHRVENNGVTHRHLNQLAIHINAVAVCQNTQRLARK
jgi:hypothetical protein